MLMLPPVSRISGVDRAESRSKRASQVDEVAAADEASARSERVEPVRRSETSGDRRQGKPDRRKQERAESPLRRAARPFAPLVAQLIATTLGLGQTRSRRRASVAEAVSAYGQLTKTPGKSHGLV